MNFKKWLLIGLFLFIGIFLIFFIDIRYGYIPPAEKVLPYLANKNNSYDLWGEHITDEEALKLKETDEGRKKLSQKMGPFK